MTRFQRIQPVDTHADGGERTLAPPEDARTLAVCSILEKASRRDPRSVTFPVARRNRLGCRELLAKKRQNAIESLPGRMAIPVDEMKREHRVCVLRHAERIPAR